MASKMETVVVGCGGMAREWVKHAVELDTIELVGLVDLSRDAAVAMADRFELSHELVFDSLKAAVEATGADAVFDVTVPVAHDKVTIDALGLGCHVLGEKPMSDTLDKARAMAAAAQASGKTYAVTQTRRPLAGFKSLEKFVAAKGIGELAELHSDFTIGAHFGGFRDAMAHPLVLDMAIHTFDNARQISGADPVSVYCHSWNPKHSWYDGHACATAIFEMTDGIVYTYRGSWCNEGCDTTWEADWRIVGSRGTITWDGAEAMKCEVVKPGQTEGFIREKAQVEIPLVEIKDEGHGYLIRQFAEHVLSDGAVPVECPYEDNIKSLAMVLAAVESADAGRKVDVVR
ncbi:MAG: Gfo/Idh/MocA family oxidoreductase [Planctomycetota bacterium]